MAYLDGNGLAIVWAKIKELFAQKSVIGDLNDLETVDNTNLVAAVNEILQNTSGPFVNVTESGLFIVDSVGRIGFEITEDGIDAAAIGPNLASIVGNSGSSHNSSIIIEYLSDIEINYNLSFGSPE